MNRATVLVILFAVLFTSADFITPPSATAGPCEDLLNLVLSDTTITLAESLPAGMFDPPGNTGPSDAPAFCRVAGTVEPAIHFEVWMPVDTWNGKFQGLGNGGLAGSIQYNALLEALNNGFATASTDTGHTQGGPAVWLGDIGLVTDYSHRGIHEMTVKAKAIIQAFYGSPAQYAYFVGCSTGGKMALMEAQRYPHDYDGIVAGEPAYNWTVIMAEEVWMAQVTYGPENRVRSKQAFLNEQVIQHCDVLDGILDGVLNDPRRCDFDPATLLCPGEDAPDCLTAAQVEAIKKLYQGPRNPRTGEQIFPGLTFGSEEAWNALLDRTGASAGESANSWFKYAVFKDPDWDFTTFDFDADLEKTAELAPIADAVDTDLSPFKSHGGKMIMYEGFSDQIASAVNPINYYKGVVDTMGDKSTNEFFRFFMVPGMFHCSGGPGTDNFDALDALIQWVEHDIAPDRIPAAHLDADGNPDRTRPLCSYPQTATYTGTGDTNDAENFVCALKGLDRVDEETNFSAGLAGRNEARRRQAQK